MGNESEDLTPIIAALLRKRGSIELPSFGMSMYPLIQEGDVSRFDRAEAEELNVGDICLFVDRYGAMTGHRLISIRSGDGERTFIFQGDTSYMADEPIGGEAILGRWSGVRRRSGRWVGESGWLSRLMRILVVHAPAIRKVNRKLGARSMSRRPMYRSHS